MAARRVAETLSQPVTELPQLDRLPPGRHAFRLVIGAAPDGTPVELPVNVAVGRAPRPRVVAVAGVHGDELEGPAALLDAWPALPVKRLRGCLVTVPVANPPAFRAGRRRSPFDDQDLNRVFPGRADGTLTERIAHRLFSDVVVDADFLLSMHSWYANALVMPYVETPAVGPTTESTLGIARILGLSWIEPIEWHPGLLVSVANRANVPAVETEIGGLGISVPERNALQARALMNLLRHLRMLPGTPDIGAPPALVRRTELRAPTAGVLRPEVTVGDPIAPGRRVGRIVDLNGRPKGEIVATASGIIAALRLAIAVEAGDLVAVLFSPLPVA